MNFDAIELSHGSHSTRCDADGNATVCAMELVAWICDEKHTDHPECVSDEIGAYLRVLNDSMPADQRQRLKPYLPRTNTQGDGKVQERIYAMADAAVRVFAANALDSAGLTLEVNTLRALAPIVDADTARSARSAAWSAWSARSAAWSAWDDALALLDRILP